MALSRRFVQLEGRYRVLRRLFLPKRFSRTGSYGRDALDKARAFRVLMHAELEAYLEDRAADIAVKAFEAWQTKKVLSLPLTGMLACLRPDGPGVPKQLGGPAFVTTRVGEAHGGFGRIVRTNHGIRESDVLRLLIPLGIEEAKIDPAWIATVDAFGLARGAAAHSSARPSGVSYTIDPHTDLQTIAQILIGLREIDEELNKIERTTR